MRLLPIATAALMLTASSAVFAQSASTTAVPAAASQHPASQAMAAKNESMRQQITANLQQSGFTDVKVLADSFLATGKDKSGNAMTMLISPDAITEVSAVAASGTGTSAGSGGIFATVPTNDDLSSKVVGLDVYNKANQDIGTIKDIAFDAKGVKAYIVGVGGFLGMGDHYVAVRPSAIDLTYNSGDKKWHASIDTTADQLKNAPEYKYSSSS